MIYGCKLNSVFSQIPHPSRCVIHMFRSVNFEYEICIKDSQLLDFPYRTMFIPLTWAFYKCLSHFTMSLDNFCFFFLFSKFNYLIDADHNMSYITQVWRHLGPKP